MAHPRLPTKSAKLKQDRRALDFQAKQHTAATQRKPLPARRPSLLHPHWSQWYIGGSLECSPCEVCPYRKPPATADDLKSDCNSEIHIEHGHPSHTSRTTNRPGSISGTTPFCALGQGHKAIELMQSKRTDPPPLSRHLQNSTFG